MCLHQSKFYDVSSFSVTLYNSVAVLQTNSMQSWWKSVVLEKDGGWLEFLKIPNNLTFLGMSPLAKYNTATKAVLLYSAEEDKNKSSSYCINHLWKHCVKWEKSRWQRTHCTFINMTTVELEKHTVVKNVYCFCREPQFSFQHQHQPPVTLALSWNPKPFPDLSEYLHSCPQAHIHVGTYSYISSKVNH